MTTREAADRTPGPDGAPWFVSVEVQVRVTAARPELAAGERLDAAGVAVLERARSRGLRTAVLSLDRGAYGDDLDWVVDHWVDCDTRDAAGIVGAVRALGGTAAAVTSAVAGCTGAAAVAARALGLRGPTPGSPALADDRGAVRRAIGRAGLPDVRWAEVAADAPDLTSPVGYPCVAWPGHGDARLVSDDRELREIAARDRARSGHGSARASRHRFVVEEHVPGPRFGADGFCDDGTPLVLAWSEIVTTPPPRLDHLVSTATTRPPVPQAAGWVRAWLAAVGHDTGPFHVEFVLGPAGPRLVDVGTALVGDGAHTCVDQVSGVDTADLLVARLLGEPATTPAAVAGACTQMHLTAHAPGRVRAVGGVRDVAAIPGLVVAEVFTGAGELIGAVAGRPERLGQVVTVGETAEQSRRRAAAALDGIHLSVDDLDPVPPPRRPGRRACEGGAGFPTSGRRRGSARRTA
ncbi:ATP-grasp domain-containing protein [Blastococcus sp. SYSU DS0541]